MIDAHIADSSSELESTIMGCSLKNGRAPTITFPEMAELFLRAMAASPARSWTINSPLWKGAFVIGGPLSFGGRLRFSSESSASMNQNVRIE
jgi:hypothetical protein